MKIDLFCSEPRVAVQGNGSFWHFLIRFTSQRLLMPLVRQTLTLLPYIYLTRITFCIKKYRTCLYDTMQCYMSLTNYIKLLLHGQRQFSTKEY